MSAQIGLRLPPWRRHNKRLRGGGVPRKPRRQIEAQALAQPITLARVEGPGSPNGVIEIKLQSNYSANGV